jgi:hypothetical protein
LVSIAISLVLINGPNKTADDHEQMQWFIPGKRIHTSAFSRVATSLPKRMEGEMKNRKEKHPLFSYRWEKQGFLLPCPNRSTVLSGSYIVERKQANEYRQKGGF